MTNSVNAGSKATLVNQKQAAAELGVSAPYLSRLTKEGRISYADVARKLYDVADVQAQLTNTSDVRQAIATETRRQAKDAGPALAPVIPSELEEDEPEYGDNHHENFKIAASFEKREAARMARIERLKLEGSLGLVVDMEREAYTEARIVRDKLLGALPAKLAPVLAPITDVFKLEQTLREAIRGALHDIVRQVEDASNAG